MKNWIFKRKITNKILWNKYKKIIFIIIESKKIKENLQVNFGTINLFWNNFKKIKKISIKKTK